jgi:NDP-sugar pyrophosphorylase family protein
LVDFLSSIRKFEKESVKDFAASHGYLTKEVEKSLEDIWQVLNGRIKLLTQDSPLGTAGGTDVALENSEVRTTRTLAQRS